MNLRYGTETETATLDESGSTVTTERNIVDNKTHYPVRKHYAMRIRVKDKKDELTEYLRFSDSIDTNRMKDVAFRIDYTKHGDENGYYYVVKCWSEVIGFEGVV